MKKAWMCRCDLVYPCFKNSKPERCERTRDFTVTPGVFLTDAEYELLINCKEILQEGYSKGSLHLGNAGDALRRYEEWRKTK